MTPDPGAGGGSVLIIEPNESIRQMLVALLRRSGFTLHAVADAAAAAALPERRFDAVVHALNFAPSLRDAAMEQLAAIAPAMLQRTVVTTTTGAVALPHAELARAFAIIHKPFDLEVVVRTVRECCDDRARGGGAPRTQSAP